MDQELEIRNLFNDAAYIDNAVEQLKELMLADVAKDCSAEIAALITKLLDKKMQIKDAVNRLTDEVVEAAEACAGVDNNWTFDDIF